ALIGWEPTAGKRQSRLAPQKRRRVCQWHGDRCVARHLRVKREVAEETILGRLRGTPLVFEDTIGTGVTEASHAIGKARHGTPRESALGRDFRCLPRPKVGEGKTRGRRAVWNGRGITLQHEFAI